MTSTSVRVLVLGLLVGAFEASAQRISLPDFSGRGAGAVRTQLVNQLCDTADCVAATKVTTGGKPDMKKAKRELLQYFVTGTVSKAKKGKGTALEVSVVAVKGTAKVKRVFPLEKNGTLSSRNLQGAVDMIRGVVGTAEPASAATPTPTPEPTPEPAPYRSSQTPSSEPTEPSEATVTERSPEPAPPPPPPRRTYYKPLVFALELGTDIVNRTLTYSANSQGVRDYGVTFPLPLLKLEFYPLALGRSDALAGLGIEGAFGVAPFLKSRPKSAEGTCTTNPTTCYSTTAMMIEAGLRWRIVVSPTFPLAVTPFVGFKIQSFTVGNNSAGERLAGLPSINFAALRAGLGLDVPVVNNLLFIVGRFAVLPVFSAGEIVNKDGPYFTSGSAFGFEASAGLAVQPAKFLQIRGSFEYTQYGLTFKTSADPTNISATGATDRYIGGNIALRLQF